MKRTILICSALALASCAAHQPLVDMRGVDANRYNADLADCQRYATQVAGAGTGAAIGAIAGALFGYAINRAAGGGYNAAAGARVSAVAGTVGGAGYGAQSEAMVVNRCMVGRGYSVLQ